MPKPSTVADIFEQLRTHGTVPWQDEDKPEEDKMLRKYTVLMITPDYLSNAYRHDTYCSWVEAENIEQAQMEGQIEAANELTDPDDTDPSRPEDFFIVFVCEGHIEDIKTW